MPRPPMIGISPGMARPPDPASTGSRMSSDPRTNAIPAGPRGVAAPRSSESDNPGRARQRFPNGPPARKQPRRSAPRSRQPGACRGLRHRSRPRNCDGVISSPIAKSRSTTPRSAISCSSCTVSAGIALIWPTQGRRQETRPRPDSEPAKEEKATQRGPIIRPRRSETQSARHQSISPPIATRRS